MLVSSLGAGVGLGGDMERLPEAVHQSGFPTQSDGCSVLVLDFGMKRCPEAVRQRGPCGCFAQTGLPLRSRMVEGIRFGGDMIVYL